MSCRTGCCRKLSFVLALLALAILAAPAFAQNCLQDEYTASGGGKLQCTANDVSIAAVKNVTIISGGVGDKCLAGQTFSFTADFEILTTSKSSRSNIGLYFGTGTTASQIGALSGTCTDSIIAPPHPCSNAAFTCGSAQYKELDPQTPPDNCGDTSSTDTSPAFGAGTEDVKIEIDNATCPLTGTSLSLPECTSWQVPGKQLTCFSAPTSYPFVNTAIPGSPSKCSCGTLSIPVQPITPSVTVAKSCNTGLSLGPGLTACDAGPEGSTVTYHVAITNTSDFGGIVVDQICDSAYGNVVGTGCTSGTAGNITSTTCPPADIANGATGTCDFTALQGELATVTDTVKVSGHSDLVSTLLFGPKSSNTVTVTSSDALSTATITKGLVTTTNACATVSYSVDVHNTGGFDETLTLSNLTDSAYGQIIPNTAAGITTTCTVPHILAPGADYTCTFDAQFCGVTGPVKELGTGTCTSLLCSAGRPPNTSCTKNSDCDLTCDLGISHTNTVSSGTIVDDNSEGNAVNETDHSLTVNECLASFTSSQ